MINKKQYSVLEWDSDFFKFKVAKVVKRNLTIVKLKSILDEMALKKIKLVYYFTDKKTPVNSRILPGLDKYYVDERIVFMKKLSNKHPNKNFIFNQTIQIEEYEKGNTDEQLYSLAIQSGENSRYHCDSKFPEQLFVKMYREWIRKSVEKELADDILVAKDKNDIIGMITLRKNKLRGEIGLIAVDQKFRGQGIGRALLAASFDWYKKHELREAIVITQGRNKNSKLLYEFCGYHLHSTEYIYHFWLNN